ncbi:hypothetical protein PAP_09710 [Palaeococcus pacificus DY20341]|uniref:Transcription regulator AsnC/Lrp ligand binding domain-containing protein n=1 Tax=Palaeococcus pacificus DY20341 TaxID=1343739 RepID=A0A075LWA6_9EURY|nr:Lrp/AsnC ligand binding domain-containing protein [Palaeococcus pacificus]AIF70317.1 hypothetical protein PAP_09710 [Palaeococcus pacificus DY20341]
MPLGIYILKTVPGKEKEVQKKLLEEFEFDEAYVVTGQFDIIAKIFVPLTRRGFEELKERIAELEGVKEVKYLEAIV